MVVEIMMDKIKKAFGSSVNIFASVLIALIILFIWLAQIRSCFPTDDEAAHKPNLNIIYADLSNPYHTKLISRFDRISTTIYSRGNNLEFYFVRDKIHLNAVSLGGGRFLFWESLGDLPEWIIDSILAHEIAHDILLHGRKQQDLDDLRGFFINIIGMQVDHNTEKVMHNWSSNLIIPIYSRSQELEADAKAVEILTLAGYKQPEDIYLRMLQYILSKYGNTGGGFFNSHPALSERIKSIRSLSRGKTHDN